MKLLGKVLLFGVGFAAGYICKKKDVFGKICEKIKKEEIKKVIKDVEDAQQNEETSEDDASESNLTSNEDSWICVDNDGTLNCSDPDTSFLEKIAKYNGYIPENVGEEPKDDEEYPKITYIPTEDMIVDKPKLYYYAMIVTNSKGEQDVKIVNEDDQIIHAVWWNEDMYSFDQMFGDEYKHHLLHDDLAADNDCLVIDNELLHVYVLIQILDGDDIE